MQPAEDEEPGDAWALHRVALARVAAGAQLTVLTLGSPDQPAAAEAVDAAAAALRSPSPALWGYAPLLGEPALRAAIAEAHGVPLEQASVTAGGQAGLYLALTVLLGASGKGEVLLPTPCYSTYADTVVAAGGLPVPVPSSADDGFALHLHALAAAVTPRTRGVLLATPNNPTGAVLSAAQLAGVGELCAARGLWCVSDETYGGCVFPGAAHVSAARVPQLAPHAVVVGSFSKLLLRPAWRLGYMLTPPPHLTTLATLCQAAHFGLSAFLQAGAAAVLDPPVRAHVEAAERGRYQARRDAFVAALRAADAGRGLAVPLAPEGGMFVLVDTRRTGVSSLIFARHLLDAHAVAVLPGEGFGGGAALGFLRVALVAEERALAAAGAAIAACAAELALAAGAGSSPPPGAQAPGGALAGRTALFAVRLDASNDGWTAAVLAGVAAAAAAEGGAVRVWRDGASDAQLEGIDALFCWDPPAGLLPALAARGLRLVASLGAGVDHCAAQHAPIAAMVPLVRCVDPLAVSRLAHYALWACLHLSRRMDVFAAAQSRGEWDASACGDASDAGATRVGVLGLGAMGAAVATTLARNGFAVRGWSRSGGQAPEGVPQERIAAGAAALPAFLAECDLLVCVLPLSPSTAGLLGAAALAALPRGAALVNVGRAEVVDQVALLAALDSGALRRAILDVAPQEPLPASSPLWGHPRVTLTPHVAGHSTAGAVGPQCVAAWKAVVLGRAPENVVRHD